MTSPSIPTSTIYQTMPPPVSPLTPHQYLPRPPPRRPQYTPNRVPSYPPSGFRPCSFHQQFMRTPPNHSDEQCRDKRHPKFTRTGAPPKTESSNANYVTAFHKTHQIPYDTFNYQNYAPPMIPQNWASPFPFTPVPNNHNEQDEQPDDTNKVRGTFTLDSAAHPTHINTPPRFLPRTHGLATRTAANHVTPCNHAGTIHIPLHNKHPLLKVPCVATPSLHANLLSVHDNATQYGAVLFTPQNGYILNLKDSSRPLVVTTAPWDKHRYTLHTPPLKNLFHASGAPTVPLKGRKQNSSNKSPSQQPLPSSLRQTPALPRKRHDKPIITPRLNNIPPTYGTPTPNPIAQAYFHWHVILNHINLLKLQRMELHKTLPILPKSLRNTPPQITCSTCPAAKQSPLPHPRKQHMYAVGSYVSSDTCGPFKPRSRRGNLHFVTYLDANSRYLIVFFYT